ncbi:hypothetical protein SLEP1_g10035 [Rubroshorea leprosula]|uniref:RING-type E3 ubiquitin transferase n=1 Tax=Rubroshorea leprosula TaxID=152421 RepID=A0AAV5ICQ4_9ROSI|nr:hypothetical protein SLEP1_g10035 [Rubroshorea leprosula]
MEPMIGDDTVCIAVGREIEESKLTLWWALRRFPLKKFCILHVHQRAKAIPSVTGVSRASSVKQDELRMVNEIIHNVMDDYLLICRQVAVHAKKLHVEMDDVAKGIVELVHRHKIKMLVMGAAANKHYSEGMTYLKSEKALYVEQHVPPYCQIWFICSGILIHTRPIFVAGPSNPQSSLSSSYLTDSSELASSSDLTVFEGVEESQCGQDPYVLLLQSGRNLDHLSMPEGSSNGQLNDQLEQALLEAEKANQEALEELVKCMRAEKTALHAIRSQASKLERLHAEELRCRRQAEDEVEKLKQQRDEEKLIALEQKSKISSLLQQLELCQKERDDLKVKLENAQQLTDQISRSQEEGTSGIDVQQSCTEFSVSDIQRATDYCDPSLKLGKGTYGSIYKGFLNYTQVAIKVLPPNRSQGNSKFQQEVDILSKLRHPNVVTLIGVCPEISAFIYEYLPNGSLKERLSCKDNSPPLTWKTRIHIATDLCSILVFLHSSRPHRIVHGNLRPRNILLDANFVCKLSEIGLPPLENSSTMTSGTSPYLDPEIHTTGILSHSSDIYSFGIILLQLMTGRSPRSIAQVVQDAINTGNLSNLVDSSAGGWPYVQAEQLTRLAQFARLALRCCDFNRSRRPDLATEVLPVLEQMRAACAALPSYHANFEENQQPPSYFLCPILQVWSILLH